MSSTTANKKEIVDFLWEWAQTNGDWSKIEEVNSYSYYTKKLKAIISTNPSPDQDEEKLASEGYGHLRAAIEIAVEDDLLKKIVKRYKKGIAFPSILRIEGHKIDTHKGKINDIYEKCCISIAGHNSPSEIDTTPTIDELKLDFEEFTQLRRVFI
ncbi:hypothetical protein QUH73_01775 [Labilibaculum sp. K2S]|uniref:hypothetical protein n=1 Tax=Labilibaculum sp. K2S TaxID=3056386 RepID=UPI0025A3E629|nr:hypothetical protein [Labilibaculum sp. K2S]MDM8158535.1 hypothetical protein [Labilibaculum sp. K2S]